MTSWFSLAAGSDRRSLSRSLLVVLVLTLAAAGPSAANQLQSASLRSTDSAAEVGLVLESAPDWTASFEGGQRLTVRLPDTVPGPQLADLESAQGLVASVRFVERGGEEPAMLVEIDTRAPVANTIVPGEEGLIVRLRPLQRLEPGIQRLRVVADPCLNARWMPSLDARVVECLPDGEVVSSTDAVEGWRRLELPAGRHGWARQEYLTELASAAQATLESTAPAVPTAAAGLEPPGESSRADVLAAANEALRREMAGVEGRAEALETANDTLRSELEVARAELRRSQVRVEELENANTTLGAEAAAAPAPDRLGELEAELEGVRRELTAARSRVEELEAEREQASEAAARLAEMGRRVDSLEAANASLQAANGALEQELAELRSEVGELEPRAAAADALRQELQAASTEAESARQRLAEMAGRIEALEAANGSLERELASVRTAADTRRSEAAASEEEARAELTTARASLARATERADDLEAANTALERQLEALRSELDDARSQAAAPEDRVLAGEARSVETTVEPPAAPAMVPEVTDTDLLVPASPVGWQAPAGGLEPVPPVTGVPAPPDYQAELRSTVTGWAAAWSDQRLQDYLSYYDREFAPDDGASRDDWAAGRQVRVLRPEWIRVGVSGLEIEVRGGERATARFQQTYESDRYADRVDKRLELVRRDGNWKITEERVEP